MENSDEHSICEMLPPMRSVKSNEQNKDVTIANSTADTDKFKKNPNTMSDDDKCVNNQDICNNKKNVKTINKNDCNVVIDDETQSKQQQQQPQLKKQQQSPPQTYGCVHYKRKAKFVVSPNENNRFK